MYADTVTRSMEGAIAETERRRSIQQAYNEANGITPRTVVKGVRDVIDIGTSEENEARLHGKKRGKGDANGSSSKGKLSAKEREALIERMTQEMKAAARTLEFEKAAYLRDEIARLRAGK